MGLHWHASSTQLPLSQTTPQPPQLFGSFSMLTSQLPSPQSDHPGLHD
jgi:hypothetical protein